jgi:hypothetical protein
MQVVVTIRLYEYMDRNTLNKGERDEIKLFKDWGEGLFRDTSARACD